jgi:UDP-N-acetyl-D-mannosaminuronate dehydrogenase
MIISRPLIYAKMYNPDVCVVGLPLAIEMSKYFRVTGFDINKKRIGILQSGSDPKVVPRAVSFT